MFPKAPKARTVYHLNKILVTINYSVHSPCIPQKTLKLYLYKPLRNSEAAPTLWNLGTSLPPQLLRPASQILCRLASQAEKKTSAELKPGVCLAVDSLFSVCDAAVKKKNLYYLHTICSDKISSTAANKLPARDAAFSSSCLGSRPPPIFSFTKCNESRAAVPSCRSFVQSFGAFSCDVVTTNKRRWQPPLLPACLYCTHLGQWWPESEREAKSGHYSGMRHSAHSGEPHTPFPLAPCLRRRHSLD